MNIFILYSINYGFVIKPTGSMKKLQDIDFSVKYDSSAKNTEEMRATIHAGKVIQEICLCVFNIFIIYVNILRIICYKQLWWQTYFICFDNIQCDP